MAKFDKIAVLNKIGSTGTVSYTHLDANSVRLNVELQLVTARTRVVYTYYQLRKACGDL